MYSDEELAQIMAAIGILDNDERVIFTQICHYAQFNNNPNIDLEDLTLEVVKWAERHNYATLRLTQTAKRVINLLVEDLQRNKFCHIKEDTGEIISLTLVEPEFEQINARYKRMMEHDITLPFPQEKDLIIPPMPDMVLEIPEADINTEIIEKVISKDIIGKIVFSEIENHILLTPKVFTQLPNLCLRKIYKYLKSPGNIKIVDFIIKSVEIIIPDKNYDSDMVMRILALEEKASAEFFVHFTENLIQKLESEKNIGDIQPVYQSAIILKQFKLEQMTQAIDEGKENDKKEDIHRILHIMQKTHRPFTRQDLCLVRDDPNFMRSFSGTYDKVEFADMVDVFITEYTKPSRTEGADLPIPPVFRLFDTNGEIYIHRDYVIPLIERERGHASTDLRKTFLEKWRKALSSYTDLGEMKRDKTFEEETRTIVRKSYPIMESSLLDSESLFNLFIASKNDADLYARMKFYYAKSNKNVLKKYIDILSLDRNEIYREAYASLPFVYRFFLTRIILYIINIFKGNKKTGQGKASGNSDTSSENSEATEEDSDSRAANSEAADRKEARTKMKTFLVDIEKNYRASGNVTEILDKLHEKWNNKLGEVRMILKEKVDKDVQEKTMAIYRIMLKSPNFTEPWLHKELRNLANNLSAHKYNEINDKKSLAMYLIIMSIWTLRNKIR
ncbi:MAG: hypothetical protein ABUK01_08945 [Leptospirales bacterium]